jgi:localization factor PodJL
MRAELPWNVAGIPPEAREAARAAARREGLSVGEWLTRRILRSFSDLGGESAAMPFDPSPVPADSDIVFDRAGLDSWGLPPSSRRDTEDMLSRVSRTEAQSSDAYRRIEEHLRTVAKRLDSAERSQSENHRAMNRTAAEINIATREQAQAFDQLGDHVMSIGGRLERLEHSAAQDGLKDAVKALHHGLSRLADQISQTANQSAQQVSSISGNMEQLSGRLGKVREEIEITEHHLETRIAAAGEETRSRFAALEAENARLLDQRLATAEKNSEALTAALDQRLTSAEEASRNHAEMVDQRLASAEEISRNDVEALDRRLASVEEAARNNAEALDQRLASMEEASHSSVHLLDQRLTAAEEASRNSADALGQRLAAVQETSRGSMHALEQLD